MDRITIPAVPVHPGEILQHEFLDPLSLTQTALAKHVGVPTRRINEICRGRRAITPETAWLLGQALGTTAEFWLNGQTIYDLSVAKREKRLRTVSRIQASA